MGRRGNSGTCRRSTCQLRREREIKGATREALTAAEPDSRNAEIINTGAEATGGEAQMALRVNQL